MGYYDDGQYSEKHWDYQDVGYGDYKDIHSYIVEPEKVGRLKAHIRAKRQVIQMLTRELEGLIEELNNETAKLNRSKIEL